MDAKCLALCLACGEYPITGKCYGLRSETQFSAKKKRETEGQFCVKGELGPRSYLDYEKVTLPREPQENSLLQVDDGHPSPGAKGSSI